MFLTSDCNCALLGVTNNGSCSQDLATIGQCECKDNVTGRRCDRCEDTYYGYQNSPEGNCVGTSTLVPNPLITRNHLCASKRSGSTKRVLYVSLVYVAGQI